jgi:hypothetical protein
MSLSGEDIERIRDENRRGLWQSMAENEHAGFPSRIRAAVRLREAEHRLNDQERATWEDEEE